MSFPMQVFFSCPKLLMQVRLLDLVQWELHLLHSDQDDHLAGSTNEKTRGLIYGFNWKGRKFNLRYNTLHLRQYKGGCCNPITLPGTKKISFLLLTLLYVSIFLVLYLFLFLSFFLRVNFLLLLLSLSSFHLS